MADSASSDARAPAPSPLFMLAVAGALVCATVIRVAAVVSASSIRNLSDDAFISLAVARTLASSGRLVTSGVQPLWVLVVSPIYALFPGDSVATLDLAARASLCLGVAADIGTLALVCLLLNRASGRLAAALGAWIWALHPAVVGIATNGLETSFAVFFTVAVACVFELAAPTPRRDVALGSLLAVAVLARVDLASLGAGLVLFTAWSLRAAPDALARLAGFVGRVGAGFAALYVPWTAFLYIQTGDVFPVSGAATAYLGYFVSVGLRQTFSQPYTLVVMSFALERLAFSAPALALASVALLPFARGLGRFRLVVWHAALVVAFYTFFVGTWWHFWRYFAPVLVVQTAIAALAVAHVARRRPLLSVAASAVVLCTVAVPCARAFPLRLIPESYASEAIALRGSVRPGQVIGAWESGALTYYLPRAVVVNLDGVADTDAYRAIRRSRLDSYILDRGVTTLVGRPFGLSFIGASSSGRVRFDEMPVPGLTFMRVYAVSPSNVP